MTEIPSLLITDRELDALHDGLEPTTDMPDLDLPTFECESVFTSDWHLGRPDSKVFKLSIFLNCVRPKNKIVVIGDGVDFWLFRGSSPNHIGRIFRDDTYLRSGLKMLQFGLHLGFRQVGWDICKPSGKETMRWKQDHNLPIQKLLRLIRKVHGIFVPGNHDELFRGFTNDLYKMGALAAEYIANKARKISETLRASYFGSPSLGRLDVLEEFVYVTKNGEHLHVCHGDRFDPPYKKSSLLGMLATVAYHGGIAPLLRAINMGDREKRLTDYVNGGHTLKDVEAYYDRYADFLDEQNKIIADYNHANPYKPPRPLLRGGIHGHLHNPGIRSHRGYVFIDSGDFVDDAHCTTAMEHKDGTWQIMTVDDKKGIHPHPITPEPIKLFSARGARLYQKIVPRVAPAA